MEDLAKKFLRLFIIMNTPNDCDVIILCGGLGTRLRPVLPDRPKVLAPIGTQPFLDILMEYLVAQGFRKFILCVGYLKEQVKEYIEKNYGNRKKVQIKFSEEEEPLGTGGALKQALLLAKSEHVLVLNGDTMCRLDFSRFFDFHSNREALLSIALTSSVREDGGNVMLDSSGRITKFQEKKGGENGQYMNVGVYFMHSSISSLMPSSRVFSLENDFFPSLVKYNFLGFSTDSKAYDIGTPERYKIAPDHILGNES